VYQLGRGNEPIIDVGKTLPAVAFSMMAPECDFDNYAIFSTAPEAADFTIASVTADP